MHSIFPRTLQNTTLRMKKFSFLLGLFAFALLPEINAQMAAKGPYAATLSTSETAVLAINDWSIYADMDSRTYFIDFEQLAVNVNEILVIDQEGNVLWQEEVYDLPVNSIYELDFSSYSSGNYTIELQAFTGVIRKQVTHEQ